MANDSSESPRTDCKSCPRCPASADDSSADGDEAMRRRTTACFAVSTVDAPTTRRWYSID